MVQGRTFTFLLQNHTFFITLLHITTCFMYLEVKGQTAFVQFAADPDPNLKHSFFFPFYILLLQ